MTSALGPRRTSRTWRIAALWVAGAWLLASGAAGLAQAAPSVPPTAIARGAVDGPGGKPSVEGRLLLDTFAAPDGATVRAGVLFDLEPGWHIYWRFPGQAGLPTQIAWSVGTGSAGPLVWPAPSVFREADGFITTYGYSHQVLLFAPLTLPAKAEGPRVVRADVRFLHDEMYGFSASHVTVRFEACDDDRYLICFSNEALSMAVPRKPPRQGSR